MGSKNNFLFTIGHSTRSTEDFIACLVSFGVERVVDVRHYPGSRYCPQFGKEQLPATLKRHGIEYVHLLSLGGRRRLDKESDLNAGWRHPAFRGYADYMQTKEFRDGLKELMKMAQEKIVVIMCSEAVPWRCHRSMIGDALVVRDFEVQDIFTPTQVRPHKLTKFAKVHRRKITYPKTEE